MSKRCAIASSCVAFVLYGCEEFRVNPSCSLERPSCTNPSMKCDIAVLGGGIGGLYSAFRLAEAEKGSVCLFEKADYFGGRLKGVQSEADPEKRWIDMGGCRLDDLHHDEKALAHELNISIQWRFYDKMITNTRGIFAPNSSATRPVFPALTTSMDEDAMYEKIMGEINWDSPREGKLPAEIEQYTAMEDYVRGMLGPEGLNFLKENFRFRDDFTNHDIKSYLQFLHMVFAEDSWPSVTGYPIGGMGIFGRTLAERAKAAGATLSKGDAVLSIDGSKADGYCVQTERNTVAAKKLIINIDPFYFKHVKGELAEALQAEKSFQDAQPIPVFTVMQRYEHRWWEGAFHGQGAGEVKRFQTTDTCLNYIEIPHHTYQNDANVLRTTYADGHCAQYLRTLAESDPSGKLLADETKRSLEYLFNMSMPAALETLHEYWPNAWYFQYPNAQRDLFEVETWAKKPLAGEDVALVGEAWSPYKAWMKGATRSATLALNEHYDLNLEVRSESPSGWPADPLDPESVVASRRLVGEVGISRRGRA